MNIKCKLYKCLFYALPISTWQAFLIDRHFSGCPGCREEAAAGDRVRKMPVSLEATRNLPPLWPSVYKKIQEQDTQRQETAVPVPKPGKGLFLFPFPKWQWAAVGLLLVMLIFFFPFSPGEKPVIITGAGQLEGNGNEQIVVESVKIGSKSAKFYIFQSKDPDKLIVWTQKNENK